jgi:hypothetical protein
MCLVGWSSAAELDARKSAAPSLGRSTFGLWTAEAGDGFNRGAQHLGVAAEIGLGIEALGSSQAHDLALGSLEYGYILTDPLCEDHWLKGNLELLGEVFGGEQYRPDNAFVLGLTPHLRYNFTPGHRWVPFLDIGAGATATDIRNGDLSTKFQFNLQAGVGAHYFLRDHLALTAHFRFLHLSNAGIAEPNLGVNTVNFLIGASWFF